MSNEENEGNPLGDESQNFGRQLSENSMEYMIFILDESLEGIKYLNRLEAVKKDAMRLMSNVAKNYIWQRDDFNLEVINSDGLLYLYGTTDYGDAVEDEWLVVYVLRELSKSHPELSIRVADEDGEFLLVEAANVLPNWLNPEIDHCRVWIQRGQLKIIPLSKGATKQTQNKPVKLQDAINYLRSNPDGLIHSPLIEGEAFYRLDKYPEHVEGSIHHSSITIPRKLAHIIHELPKTISAAVEAFYLRDHAGMKKITSESEPLHLSPADFVTISVRFSRVLFAQLRSQRFDAPVRWQKIMQSQNGGASTTETPNKNTLALEDGMKLTCGYEMLAIAADKHKSRAVREFAIMLDDLTEDGDEELPTNDDIKKWPDVARNDDEGWLDINYEDFERELEGKRVKNSDNKEDKAGFGDARTQEDLRKIVSRFEAFLNNDTAGLDGADVNDMDVDNDDDDDSDDSDENSDMEDKEVSFDEETFARMMKEMMGLPADTPAPAPNTRQAPAVADEGAKDAENTEEDDIKNLSMQMEAELKGHGALRMDGTKSEQSRLQEKEQSSSKAKGKQKQDIKDDEEEEDSDGEVDIDYNLAKNLLESFKSQGGMAGPTGNLLGLMGIQLPRDEDDGNDQDAESSSKK